MAEDKKMNQFTSATDGAYIYAEAANGSQVKIDKIRLADILGGVYNREMQGKDLNKCVDTGIYVKQTGDTYLNSPSTDACLLITFATSLYAVQWLHELNSNAVYYRSIIKYSSIYHNWVRIN